MGKILKRILLLLILGGLVYLSLEIYQILKVRPHTAPEITHFYVERSHTFEDVVHKLESEPFLIKNNYIQLISSLIGYNQVSLKYGRFKIPDNYSYFSLIRRLKGGLQDPVNVVINNERTLDILAGKLDRYLEPDSISFLDSFLMGSFLVEEGYTSQNLMSLFIPNTYQFLWDTRPDQFLARMLREHKKFWAQDNRLQKADSLGLNTKEVYTLASIVEKESRYAAERPTIAGLYLNRLAQGILLQADPTVVFALGDFTINRVLHKHLAYESPYNTYLYPGLPPGPIAMASINSIDAVLNAEKHDYIYMCAAPDQSGKHVFAVDYADHQRNAAKYRNWLNEVGIK